MKRLSRIWVIGEKNIFNELVQIINIAIEANTLVRLSFKLNYEEKALTENMQAVRALEKKSDAIAFTLGGNITSGAVSPNTLSNLLQCVLIADDIVDLHYYLIRELYRMSQAKFIDFTVPYEPDWNAVYEDLLSLAKESLLKLEKAFSTANLSEILELGKQIEAIEEQGDDIKDAGFDKLYSAGSRLHFLQFHHYSELLYKCDDILDSCEDLSNLIVSVVTSILK